MGVGRENILKIMKRKGRHFLEWRCVHISEALRGGVDKLQNSNSKIQSGTSESEQVGKLFELLRAGVVKRKTIAERLGITVAEVTNCRKRLDRKLDELEKAGYPAWAIEEWKRR